jgi:hypothetical protein
MIYSAWKDFIMSKFIKMKKMLSSMDIGFRPEEGFVVEALNLSDSYLN